MQNKFLNVNEIIVYKIVSDTPNYPIKKEIIPCLIKNRINIIEELLVEFEKKEDFFKEIEDYIQKVKTKMKLTKTQENQLKDRLTFYKIKNLPFPFIPILKTKKEVKKFISSF